jgi:hypothetical protein
MYKSMGIAYEDRTMRPKISANLDNFAQSEQNQGAGTIQYKSLKISTAMMKSVRMAS